MIFDQYTINSRSRKTRPDNTKTEYFRIFQDFAGFVFRSVCMYRESMLEAQVGRNCLYFTQITASLLQDGHYIRDLLLRVCVLTSRLSVTVCGCVLCVNMLLCVYILLMTRCGTFP